MPTYIFTALRAAVAATLSIAFLASAAIAQTSSRTTDDWSRYMDATTLQTLMTADPSVQVIDIRDEKYIAEGVIPGAVWIHISKWRGPAERPGRIPSEAELEALLGSHGLRIDQPIVVLNHDSKTIQTGRAAIVYWILKSAGTENVAILNGGFTSWQEAQLPIATAHFQPTAQTVDITYSDDWRAGPLDIYGLATGQVEGAILDARLDGQVRKAVETGKPLMSMPMAQFIPASLFTNPLSDKALDADAQADFRADLESRGINLGSEFLISVCQTGELSALSWFYASEIVGIENVRYYPDALQGWEADGGLMFGLHLPD